MMMAETTPQRRFLCLYLPRLATDRLRRSGFLADDPGVTVQRVSNAAILDGVNRRAQAAGLRPGMTLASARAMCPELVSAEAEPTLDRALLEQLALWCDRFSPMVALDGADGLMLDITGCAHLFGKTPALGEGAMMRLARQGLAAQGISATAAIAATSGAAAALARFSGQVETHITETDKLSNILAPLPVAALVAVEPGIGPESLIGLEKVGLRRIGDLTGLPRASLAARFGLALARALDKALGDDPRPIAPRPIRRPYRVRLGFPDPIGTAEDIATALNRLLSHLCTRLENEGRGCRRLDWRIMRADGTDQVLTIGTARPSRDPDQLFRLFAETIGTVAPGDGIDAMLLSAPKVEVFDSGQDQFSVAQTRLQSDPRQLEAVIDRLTNRLGSANVFRLRPVDSHLPDCAQARAAPVSDRAGMRGWQAAPTRRRNRPLRLLDTPYLIEPLSGAEGFNAPTAFRIFGRRMALRIIRGPERIAPEWWRQDAGWRSGIRDYFDVEDETGRRFWIYRDHATDPHRHARRWYLQGVF